MDLHAFVRCKAYLCEAFSQSWCESLAILGFLSIVLIGLF